MVSETQSREATDGQAAALVPCPKEAIVSYCIRRKRKGVCLLVEEAMRAWRCNVALVVIAPQGPSILWTG